MLLEINVVELEYTAFRNPFVPIFVPATVVDEVLGLLVFNLGLDALCFIQQRPVKTQNLFAVLKASFRRPVC